MCFSLESRVVLCEHSASCVLHCSPAGALYPRPWLNNQYQRSNGVVMCQPNESLMTVICSPCWTTLVLIRRRNWEEFESRTTLFFENGNVQWLFLRSVPNNYVHSCRKAKKPWFCMYEEMLILKIIFMCHPSIRSNCRQMRIDYQYTIRPEQYNNLRELCGRHFLIDQLVLTNNVWWSSQFHFYQ